MSNVVNHSSLMMCAYVPNKDQEIQAYLVARLSDDGTVEIQDGEDAEKWTKVTPKVRILDI